MSADPYADTHLLNCRKEEREGNICCDYLWEDGSGKCCFYPDVTNFTGVIKVTTNFVIPLSFIIGVIPP